MRKRMTKLPGGGDVMYHPKPDGRWVVTLIADGEGGYISPCGAVGGKPHLFDDFDDAEAAVAAGALIGFRRDNQEEDQT